MLTNITFWESIPAEKILIFQSDSAVCSLSPYFLELFLIYDYIGAAWRWNVFDDNILRFLSGSSKRPKKSTVISWEENGFFGGNGGFSIRSRSSMIECVNLTTNGSISYPKYRVGFPEDVWFSYCVRFVLRGKHLPNRKTQIAFAWEGVRDRMKGYPPFGIHKSWGDISNADWISLLHICPEVNATRERYRQSHA
jgi:hypothetical protein